MNSPISNGNSIHIQRVVQRDYGDAALGYTGNLRRFSAGVCTSSANAEKRATKPAGCLQRLRTTAWKMLARCIPLPSLRASLLRGSHARDLSAASADLLGTLTLKRGSDSTGIGAAALRSVVMKIAVLHQGLPEQDEIIAHTLQPILDRHLSRLTQFDLRKIETGIIIDVNRQEWPNADERRVAQLVMTLITQAHARRTTLQDASRDLQVWMDMLPGRAGTAYDLGVLSQCFCRFLCADVRSRIPREKALCHAVASLSDADLGMLLSALSLREEAPGVSPYKTLKFALVNSAEMNAVLPASAREAALESLRQTAQRVALSRHAYSATEQRAKFPELYGVGATHPLDQTVRRWCDALYERAANAGCEHFSETRETQKQATVSAMLAIHLDFLGVKRLCKKVVTHLDTATLARIPASGMSSPMWDVVERELNERLERVAALISATNAPTPVDLGRRLGRLSGILDLETELRGDPPLPCTDDAELGAIAAVQRQVDASMRMVQANPRAQIKVLGLEALSALSAGDMGKLLDMRVHLARHGWRLDEAGVSRLAAEHHAQAIRETHHHLRQLYERLERDGLGPETVPWTAWARVLDLVMAQTGWAQRTTPGFGADDRASVIGGSVDKAADAAGLTRRAGRDDLATLLALALDRFGTLGTPSDISLEKERRGIVLGRLNSLLILLVATMDRCGQQAVPLRGDLVIDITLQREFDRIFIDGALRHG